jgi:putative endonuclease
MGNDGRFCVYILASRKYGALYTGFTGDLGRRVHIHRESVLDGFSSRYRTHHLVYFEQHGDPRAAITREKQIKAWKREWKIELIERSNPDWRDLFVEIFGSAD